MPGASDAALYWGFVALLIAGVFAMPAFPSQDGAIHLYNFGLIESLASGDPGRGEFFRVEIDSPIHLALPRLGSLLIGWLPAWAVERLFIALHVAMLAWFAVAWLRAHERAPYPGAWAALAFAFPWSLFMGFYAYQLASDIALLALVAAWRWRDASLLKLAGVVWIAGAFVLAFHAVAAALFAALIALLPVVADRDRAIVQRLVRGAALSLPILLAILSILSSADGEAPWRWPDPSYAIVYLATLGRFVFQGQLLSALVVAGTFLFLCARRESLASAPYVWSSAALLALLHLALPDALGGGGYLTGRFAWWIPLLLLPALDCDETSGATFDRRWLPPALALLSIAMTIRLAAPSAAIAAEVQQGAALHPIDGRISAALFDRDPRSEANLEPLRHAVAWFAMDGGIVTTNYQARERFFPVRLTERAARLHPDVDVNAAWETDWGRLPLDALLSVDAEEADRERLARNFESVWLDSSKRVELWRRR